MADGYGLLLQPQRTNAVEQEGICPTVLIGLGGTGGDILLKVKKKVYERYGDPAEEFPILKFLYIDTDTSNQHIDSALLEEYKFTTNERVDAVVQSTARYTRDLNNNPTIKPWWYPSMHDLMEVTTGAGQIRAYSRLAFFVNFDQIKSSIEYAVQEAASADTRNRMLTKRKITVENGRVNIYVVGSLAGGTGSGMFLDMGFLCRHLSRTGHHTLTTVAFLLFPGVFLQQSPRIFANSFAALKELEHFTFPENKFNYKWAPNYPDGKDPVPPPPFDYCYLVDSVNEAGTAIGFPQRYSLFDMVANYIFQDFGSSNFADHKRAVRVNLDYHLTNFYVSGLRDDTDRELLSEAFTTRYSSLGMTLISYPADRVKHACAARLASDVMQRLARGQVPNTDLNAFVRGDFMRDKVALYIGDRNINGRPVRFHDIFDNLYATGVQGRTLDVVAKDFTTKLRNDIRSRTYLTQNMSSSQYIQMRIDQELLQLRDEDAGESDWQRWGTYPRTMKTNKDRFLAREVLGEKTPEGRLMPSRLDEAVSELVNDPERGIQFAKMALKQIRIVLTEPAYPYRKTFENEVAQLQKALTEKRKAYQDTLNELTRRETEGRLTKFLYASTIPHLETQTVDLFEDYMLTAVRLRSRKEAIAICDAILEHVGEEAHIIDEKRRTEETGLMRRLTELESSLAELKAEFDRRKTEFAKTERDALATILYESADVDAMYYPRYLGHSEEEQAQNVAKVAKELLGMLPSVQARDRLGIKVMELPSFVARLGMQGAVKAILDQTRRKFDSVDSDFEVLELFFDKYRSKDEQVAQLNLAYNKAQVWMKGSLSARFKLSDDRRIFIIGRYRDPDKPKVYDYFEHLIQHEIKKPGGVSIAFRDMPSKSEVAFYSEAAGFPLCYSQAIHEMRPKYENLMIEQHQNLHADRNEFRFRDILETTEDERREIQDATRTFLVGVILEIVKVRYDSEDHLFYVEELSGLTAEPRSLGTEMRAVRTLIRDKKLRDQVDSLIRRREQEIAAADRLAGYFAVLDVYQSIYPPKRLTTSAKDDRQQATTENLVLRREIGMVMSKVAESDREKFRQAANDEKKRYEDLRRQVGDQKYLTFNFAWAKAAHVEA